MVANESSSDSTKEVNVNLEFSHVDQLRDLENEVKIPYVIPNKIIMSPGTWNGNNYSLQTLKNGFERSDFSNKDVRSLFYEHKDDNAKEWIGEVVNPHFVGEDIVADLIFVNKQAAMDVAYGAKFGISPRLKAFMSSEFDVEDFEFVNNSLVINPAVKTTFINNKENKDNPKGDVVISPKIIKKEVIKMSNKVITKDDKFNKDEKILEILNTVVAQLNKLSDAEPKEEEKVEVKEEPVEEVKEEPKVEVKEEEPTAKVEEEEKVEVKEEPKVEVKEEVKEVEEPKEKNVENTEKDIKNSEVKPEEVKEPKEKNKVEEKPSEEKSMKEDEKYKEIETKMKEVEEKIKKLETIEPSEVVQKETLKGVESVEEKKELSTEEADESMGAIMNASMSGSMAGSKRRWSK